ncbi:MAG: succinylglutamate desuccinylase/aspartoacylase family protein [Acidobacteriota bacterium]
MPVEVPLHMPFVHDIRPGAGVTAATYLSAYLGGLANTAGDTPVFVLEGRQPGGTIFVAGGTHANEIAGVMAAIALIERATVEQGRLIVIPHANNAAVDARDPVHPGPQWVTLGTGSGARRFKYGSRLTRPDLQGAPDPPEFRHPHALDRLAGHEARNLDRAYPGRPNGTLTERIAWAIVRLLKTESVDVAFDLHEAGPGSRLAWMIVAHPRSIDLAALAVVNLDFAGIPMKLEHSSETFRGLSHREWGDATKAHTFLVETPNPAQADGAANADVVGDPTLPLEARVGVQLSTLLAVLDAYNDNAPPRRQIRLTHVPELSHLHKSGLGAFLQ